MSLREVIKLELLSAVRSPFSLATFMLLPSLALLIAEAAGGSRPHPGYAALLSYQLVSYLYPALLTQLFKGRGRMSYLLQPFKRHAPIPLFSAASALPWMVAAATLLGYTRLLLRGDHSWLGAWHLSLMAASALYSFAVSLFIAYVSGSRSRYDLFLALYQATLLAIILGGSSQYIALIHPAALWIFSVMGEATMPPYIILAYLLLLTFLLLALTSRALHGARLSEL